MEPVIKKLFQPSTSGTIGCILPKPFTEALGLENSTLVQIDLEEDAIVIRKAPFLPPRNKKKENGEE